MGVDFLYDLTSPILIKAAILKRDTCMFLTNRRPILAYHQN